MSAALRDDESRNPGALRIVVFVRPVHNPAFSIEPGPSPTMEGLPGYQPIANPQDELALEFALGLKESSPLPVHLLACSVGGEPSVKVLREFLACGTDEAVWIESARYEPDGWIVARHLAEFFRNEPFDLGLFGARDLDTGAGQVGSMFGAMTGLACLDSVTSVRWDGQARVEVVRRQKRLHERILMDLPACLGIQRGKPLRYPSFRARLRAETTRARRIVTGTPPLEPLVERQKFAPSKPRKASAATDYAQAATIDRIRQAYGLSGTAEKHKGDSLIRGAPEQAARKVLSLWKQEKLIAMEEESRK